MNIVIRRFRRLSALQPGGWRRLNTGDPGDASDYGDSPDYDMDNDVEDVGGDQPDTNRADGGNGYDPCCDKF